MRGTLQRQHGKKLHPPSLRNFGVRERFQSRAGRP